MPRNFVIIRKDESLKEQNLGNILDKKNQVEIFFWLIEAGQRLAIILKDNVISYDKYCQLSYPSLRQSVKMLAYESS